MSDVPSPYSAILLVSYGSPRQPGDVLPFMRNATAGRGVPDERLLEVSQHYQPFGGCSPISEQNEALRDALMTELKRRGHPRPVMIEDHNRTPFFTETVSALHRDRHDRMVALTTVACSCYPTCRQYQEDLAATMEQIPGVAIGKVSPYLERNGFISANVDALVAPAQALRSRISDGVTKVSSVTHSIPVAVDAASTDGTPVIRYNAQHIRVVSRTAEAIEVYLGERLDWELVYCSRSGSPYIFWLEPDVNDHLAGLAGIVGVIATPIGSTSSHMEVAYDLDTQTRGLTATAGFGYERAATAGIHPDFIAILANLLLEQAAVVRGELAPPDHPCLTEPASCYLPHPQKEQVHIPSTSHTH